MTTRTILLNPGPVTLSDRVRRAAVAVDLCHREKEFADLTLEVRRGLEALYPELDDRYDAVLLTGSGTAAVEAMATSLVGPDDVPLVICNGVYGERIADMLELRCTAVRRAAFDWLEGIDFARLRSHLEASPRPTHVLAVHHETTTGRLNVVDDLASLCGEYGAHLLLDAVSSFGGELLTGAWHARALAGTANKCLHGIPGLSFVLVEKGTPKPAHRPQSLYLNLWRYREMQSSGLSPFTQSVPAVLALREALAELDEGGGWTVRRARYRSLMARIRAALSGAGVQPLIPAEASSSMLAAFRVPEGLTYERVHGGLKERGFITYAGQGRLTGEVFRIACMGDIHDDDADRLVAALGEVFAA